MALVLAVALAGCSTTASKDSWFGPTEGERLEKKVKLARNTYFRFSLAEEDARKDGFPEAIEHYSRAKAAAQKELENAERELSAYEAAKGVKAPKTTP